jgi:hypothetical protein
VVAVEDGAGLVACHLHGHGLRDALVHHLANSRAPEVVAQTPRYSCFPARGRLRLAEVADALPPVRPLEMDEQVRDDLELPIHGASSMTRAWPRLRAPKPRNEDAKARGAPGPRRWPTSALSM